MNVKLNDNVVVIAGNHDYKGKQGKVIAVSPKTNKVTVEGVNIQHKHEKARSAQQTSQIVNVEGPIDVSNVMVVCPVCGQATRVGHKVVDGKSVRVCLKKNDGVVCGAILDRAYAKAAPAKEEAVAEAPKKRTRKRTAKKAAETVEASEEKND